MHEGANIADPYIVEHSSLGHVVITADIPLPAQLVANQVFVLDPRGEVYHDCYIGSRLASHGFLSATRGDGVELSSGVSLQPTRSYGIRLSIRPYPD